MENPALNVRDVSHSRDFWPRRQQNSLIRPCSLGLARIVQKTRYTTGQSVALLTNGAKYTTNLRRRLGICIPTI